MALNGVIQRFKTGTYNVTRQVENTYVDGERIDGVGTTVIPMDAVIQPAKGSDLESVPEADRTSNMKLVFTEVPLLTRRPGFEPDAVEYKGEAWTVVTSEECEHWGETHWRAFIGRDEVT